MNSSKGVNYFKFASETKIEAPASLAKTSYVSYNPQSKVVTANLVGRSAEDVPFEFLLSEEKEALQSIPDDKLDAEIKDIFNKTATEFQALLTDKATELPGGACFTGNLQIGNKIYNANVGDCCGFTSILDEKTGKVTTMQLSSAVFNWNRITTLPEQDLTPEEIQEKRRIENVGFSWVGFTRSFGDVSYHNSAGGVIATPAVACRNNTTGKTMLSFTVTDGIAEILNCKELDGFIEAFFKANKIKTLDELTDAHLRMLAVHIIQEAKKTWPIKIKFTKRDDMSIAIALHIPKENVCVFFGNCDGHGGDKVALFIPKKFSEIFSKHIFIAAKKFGYAKKVVDEKTSPQKLESDSKAPGAARSSSNGDATARLTSAGPAGPTFSQAGKAMGDGRGVSGSVAVSPPEPVSDLKKSGEAASTRIRNHFAAFPASRAPKIPPTSPEAAEFYDHNKRSFT